MHACMLSHFSRVWLFDTQWTVACQALLSMKFPRQEYYTVLGYLDWVNKSLPKEDCDNKTLITKSVNTDVNPICLFLNYKDVLLIWTTFQSS